MLKSKKYFQVLKTVVESTFKKADNLMKNDQEQTPANCRNSEAVAKRCSVKKVFFEISQNSQENTCARVSFLIK